MQTFLDPELLAKLSKFPLKARTPMAGDVSGKHGSPHRGSSVEFAEYRKYVIGDDLRRLDWKVLARTDRFYIKEYEAETNLRGYFVLDTSGSMSFQSAEHETKLHYAKRVAASLAYLMVKQGDAVGLSICNDQASLELSPFRNPAQLAHFFQTLDEATSSGETKLAPALHLLAEKAGKHAQIIILSDFFTDLDELTGALQHLHFRKHEISLLQIMDPQEISFSFEQIRRFVDLENGTSLLLEPSLILEKYHENLNEFLKNLREKAQRIHAHYQRVQTDHSLEAVLREFLLKRLTR